MNGDERSPAAAIDNRGNFIGTYSGIKFYPQNPRPEEITITDIAHALSNSCRYTGHCKKFYSVAEHSVLVSSYLYRESGDPVLALTGLLHDASEAYLTDVPRPIKPMLPAYKDLEENIQRVICEKYDLPFPFPDEVHEADNRALFNEAPILMALPTSEWSFQLEPLPYMRIHCDGPIFAKSSFLEAFHHLTNQRNAIDAN